MPAAASRATSAEGLGHLHQRQDPLLHPRPPEAQTSRPPRAAPGRAPSSGRFLADDRAHRAAVEVEIHHRQRERPPATVAMPLTTASRSPVFSRASRSVADKVCCPQTQRIGRDQLGVAFLERAFIDELGDPVARRQAFVMAALGADAQTLLPILFGQDFEALRALDPHPLGDAVALGGGEQRRVFGLVNHAMATGLSIRRPEQV